MLQFSKYEAVTYQKIKCVSLAPVPTQKDDEVLTLISDGSLDRAAWQDMD